MKLEFRREDEIGGTKMRHYIYHSLICVGLLLFVLSCSAFAQGTALMLGAGQELRLDLPLESQKTYKVSTSFRTDLPNAIVTMTLCAIHSNNEVVEYQTVNQTLGEQGIWHTLYLEDVQIPQSPVRWELVLKADVEGRYWWKELTVERIYGSEQGVEEYWSKKLASDGTFYTGLVIDARHLDVQRGISPRIYSESGQLLYGGVLAPQDVVQELGVVGYGQELTSELLGRLSVDPAYTYVAPLIIEATAVADAAKTGVCISEADTARVLEAMAKYDFFARYAVIFLVK